MSPSGRMTAAFGIGRRPATWLSCARSPSTSWAGTEHPGSACGRVASRPPGMTSTCSLFWLDDFMRRPWLGLLVAAFVREGPVVIGLDDTIERRWGTKIKARGIYRDPV